MTQRAYKRWVLNDALMAPMSKMGGDHGGSCLTRDMGVQLPNQGYGGGSCLTRGMRGSCLIRGMGEDITRGGGEGKGEGGKGIQMV